MNSLLAVLPALVTRDDVTTNDTRVSYKFCTEPSDLCPLDSSYYYYRMDLGANATFAALFAVSLIGFLGTFIATRRAFGFSFAMICGVILEIIGYAGRLMSWKNQWDENGFLIQIVCLTIAPAFMAAGIYLCLRRIVYAFGPENSRIKPETYTRLFIPCDLLSLILQGTGGGMASTASHQGTSTAAGNNIMIAGLAFQVFTLLIFMCFCIDFAIRTRRRFNALGDAGFNQSPAALALRGSLKFKGFLGALALATICIFWRSVYRVVELGEGWEGDLIKRQWLFVGFEGVMVIVACLVLNIFHPAFCFKEGVEGLGGVRALWRRKIDAPKTGSGSGSTSDVETAKA